MENNKVMTQKTEAKREVITKYVPHALIETMFYSAETPFAACEPDGINLEIDISDNIELNLRMTEEWNDSPYGESFDEFLERVDLPRIYDDEEDDIYKVVVLDVEGDEQSVCYFFNGFEPAKMFMFDTIEEALEAEARLLKERKQSRKLSL
ncbi:MAG: hypothetical protein PUG74_05050 [Prevotellaceae bacterium]|nr:hypothetical protein [Prevotellaceae bacterium]